MVETNDSTTTTELIHVPFDDGEILCVRSSEDGEFVVIKTLCERIGVDARGQQQRIQRASWGKSCACIMHVQLPGDVQRREVFVLSRKRIAMWLATIDTNRVNEEVRPYLEALQERAADVLDAYFMGGEAPAAPQRASSHHPSKTLDPERLAKADALAELARTFEGPQELGARRGLLAQRCRVLGVRLPSELGLGRGRKRPTSASSAVQEQPAATSTALVQVEARQEPSRSRLRAKQTAAYVVYEPHPSEPWWASEEEMAKVLPLPATQIRKTLIDLDLCEMPVPNFSRYQRVRGVPTMCYSPMASYRVMKYWRRPAPTLIDTAARAMALDLGVDL